MTVPWVVRLGNTEEEFVCTPLLKGRECSLAHLKISGTEILVKWLLGVLLS